MIVQKVVTEDIEVKFSRITLLSVEEYEEEESYIPYIDRGWWLRSPGLDIDGATCVMNYGVDEDYVCYSLGVRPALKICGSDDLCLGDKLNIKNEILTIIPGGYALYDKCIGDCPFCYDYMAPDANDYEKSDIKNFIESWAKEQGIEFVEDQE